MSRWNDLRLRHLAVGDLFVFESDQGKTWEYRGNGWYSHPDGYDGGPWYSDGDPRVLYIETIAETRARLRLRAAV
jgi:hypothetical protein